MKLKQLAAMTGIAMLTFTAYAGDKNHVMKIEIASDDGAGETRLVLDSDELGFDLHDMQVGENQSIVDSEGRPVLITRTEDGHTFDVDGKTIEMPDMMTVHGENVWVGDIDVDKRADAARSPPVLMGGEGVVVISGKEISEATQQAIRDALAADGHPNVDFAGGHDEEIHRVKIIQKVVETPK